MRKQANRSRARERLQQPQAAARKTAKLPSRQARKQAKESSRVARRQARAATRAAKERRQPVPVAKPNPARAVTATRAARASSRTANKPARARPAKVKPMKAKLSSLFGPNEKDSLEVAERQLTLLVRTSALLGQENSREVALDRSSYLLLYTLEKKGPSTISTLAAEVCLAPSTVTRQVATMGAAGLVSSAPAPDDRRARVITMQAHGRELFTAERRRRRKLLRTITGTWTEDEWNQLAELLGRLNASLGELFEDAPLAYEQ